MALECPFCAQPNADQALVCNSCARDIAIPASLLAERDGLIRKREAVRDELSRAKAELESYKIGKGRIAAATG
ncbi:MAG: hypothetical protein NTZ72_10535 [Afipia sp.]|jgi:hypothetical protein|nr:hypothetical protein [Afipia sp.]